MTVIERIITAIHHVYGTESLKGTIVQTTTYFNDGTQLDIEGCWTFKVGETYRFVYTDGNPVTITAITMLL